MKYLLLALLLLLDASSKWCALHFLPAAGVPILPDWFGVAFSLDFVTNTGTAWGLFADHPLWLFLGRVAMLAGLVVYVLRTPGAHWALWLIIVGALGNVVDTMLYGHVIDFFHFTFWGYSFPVFNWADTYITLGVAGLLCYG